MYDYVPGRMDWFAAGLPMEGRLASVTRAGDLARADVPICGLDEHVGDVKKRVLLAGWDACVVTNDERVVLGALTPESLELASDATAEEVMEPGPTTSRPNEWLEDMGEYMRKSELQRAWITTGDGKLVGALLRDDVERALAELAAHHDNHHGNGSS